MGLVSSQMQPGYDQSLVQVREALESRLTNATRRLPATPSFHRGTPDPEQLPDELLGVWLDWTDSGPDADGETGQSESVINHWLIFICTREDDNDSFGQGSDLGIQVWGSFLRTLTEHNVDIGLDASCDFVLMPTTRHGHGTVAGGNKRVDVIELAVDTHMQAEWVRCPP